jgi:FkbM family methyltransferase
MKIVYVTPHLSTGGMPEYLRNKINLLKDDNEIWVVEKSFEPAYRTVRDKIESLIGKKLITLSNNLQNLPNLIHQIKPDVIHFEELSDYHFPSEVLDQIYTQNRSWKIFETLHDSSIDHYEKRYIPDKMLVVSPWQIKNFLELNIPIEIIQHELKPGIRNREYGLKQLNLHLNVKHVLQVGLFSVRKNQIETVELARRMPDVQFHFVGSLTDNYSSYWQPILDDLPKNCKVWGERPDPETFYSCMDLVVFPSRGNYGDRETNPLVIRESISWKIPLLVRDLPFYLGMYQESENVKFMKDEFDGNIKIIRNLLNMNNEINNTELKVDDNFFKKKLFNIKFDEDDNKINFEYLGEQSLSAKVCVRDIDTQATIYTFDMNLESGMSYWCIPIPKKFYDFGGNPNFGGFLYDFYQNDKKVYTMTTRLKRTQFTKRKCKIETHDPIFVNYEQFFTDKIYDKIFSEITELDNCIDIGCNIGLFTDLLVEMGASNVISVEINNSAINSFTKLHQNNSNVKLISKAISDENGLLDIFEDPSNSLVSSLYQNHTSNLVNKNIAQSITLDSLFDDEKIEKISLLKMDIEGAEYKAFSSISNDNLKKIDFMVVEFHDNYGGILRESILDKLESNGFSYEILQDDCIGEAYEYEERGTLFVKKIS